MQTAVELIGAFFALVFIYGWYMLAWAIRNGEKRRGGLSGEPTIGEAKAILAAMINVATGILGATICFASWLILRRLNG